jgi:hypothetical protein
VRKYSDPIIRIVPSRKIFRSNNSHSESWRSARRRSGQIIEDLHWVDSASQELLGRIVEMEARLRLLLVTTRTPEYIPLWLDRAAVAKLRLEPLPVGHIRRLVQSRLGVDVLPDALARQITDKAEGNPLFAEEIGMIHMAPGGRSKIISRSADQFPVSRWSTFGLSSSPRAISKLAKENRWTMSPGDKVRLLDIGPSKGGIVDLVDGPPEVRAKRSVKLIAKLERGYSNNTGHTIPEWILYLMPKNRAKRIMDLANKFIRQVGARGQGWSFGLPSNLASFTRR